MKRDKVNAKMLALLVIMKYGKDAQLKRDARDMMLKIVEIINHKEK
jgi:hypothetical protein